MAPVHDKLRKLSGNTGLCVDAIVHALLELVQTDPGRFNIGPDIELSRLVAEYRTRGALPPYFERWLSLVNQSEVTAVARSAAGTAGAHTNAPTGSGASKELEQVRIELQQLRNELWRNKPTAPQAPVTEAKINEAMQANLAEHLARIESLVTRSIDTALGTLRKDIRSLSTEVLSVIEEDLPPAFQGIERKIDALDPGLDRSALDEFQQALLRGVEELIDVRVAQSEARLWQQVRELVTTGFTAAVAAASHPPPVASPAQGQATKPKHAKSNGSARPSYWNYMSDEAKRDWTKQHGSA